MKTRFCRFGLGGPPPQIRKGFLLAGYNIIYIVNQLIINELQHFRVKKTNNSPLGILRMDILPFSKKCETNVLNDFFAAKNKQTNKHCCVFADKVLSLQKKQAAGLNLAPVQYIICIT